MRRRWTSTDRIALCPASHSVWVRPHTWSQTRSLRPTVTPLALSYAASYARIMADTVTIRIDAHTAHALDVLTRNGVNRSEAIRQTLIEAAERRERLAEMKRAFLRLPLPDADGLTIADTITEEREGQAS